MRKARQHCWHLLTSCVNNKKQNTKNTAGQLTCGVFCARVLHNIPFFAHDNKKARGDF